MQLRLYMTAKTTEALGPYKRYAIWVQGCNKRCKGCISPGAQPLTGGYSISIEALATDILSIPDIEGITISGGEPFLQQEALCELIDLVRIKRDIGVITYTGMLYSEIRHSALANRCDLIIDGEYVEALNDDKSLRGSSNQQIIRLTERYYDCVDCCYGIPGRKVEFIPNGKVIQMVGIPSKNLGGWIRR